MSGSKFNDNDEFHTQALLRLFDSNLRTLRDIKRQEMVWLQIFSIMIGPATGLLAATDVTIQLRTVITFQVLFLLFTGWIQRVLFGERQSYYNVVRFVLRMENFFGLLNARHLPLWMKNAPFPKGMGPPEGLAIDGTQRWATFRHRYTFTICVLIAFVIASSLRSDDVFVAMFWGIVIVGVSIWHGYHLNQLDDREMRRKNREEITLPGSIPEWILDQTGNQPTNVPHLNRIPNDETRDLPPQLDR